jgi:hypothetical protein
MNENKLQAKCFQWFWNNFPGLRRTLWAVPNGGKRDKREAMTLKATGVISGVHDLHFIYNNRFYTFELKVGNNKFSENQLKYMEAIENQGAMSFEIRNFDQFREIITKIIGNGI